MEKIKDLQDKISLEMDILFTDKVHLINEKRYTDYEDIIELHIISIMKNHINETLNQLNEEVPLEILIPWGMVKIHELLLNFHNQQSKIETDEYLDILNKVSNRLFLRLFSTHIE